MLILDVTKEKKSEYEDYLSALLAQGLTNDYLFEKYMFTLTVELEKGEETEFLYRLMWEQGYLRRESNQTSSVVLASKRRVSLLVSVSEAIAFIAQSTPKIIANDIYKTHCSSLDAIKNALEQLLIVNKETGLLSHELTLKRICRICQFDTQWTDKEGTKKVKLLGQKDLSDVWLVRCSTHNFDELTGEFPTDSKIFVQFIVDFRDKNVMLDRIVSIDPWITNISDMPGHTFVECSVNIWDKITFRAVSDRLKESYRELLK